VTDMTAFTQCR